MHLACVGPAGGFVHLPLVFAPDCFDGCGLTLSASPLACDCSFFLRHARRAASWRSALALNALNVGCNETIIQEWNAHER
jgi:hypothetical protein